MQCCVFQILGSGTGSDQVNFFDPVQTDQKFLDPDPTERKFLDPDPIFFNISGTSLPLCTPFSTQNREKSLIYVVENFQDLREG